MSDPPSINSLLKKKSDNVRTTSSLPVTSPEMSEKFVNKMSEIKHKELELEAERLAARIKTPYINLEKFPISQEALRQVPREIAEELKAVCFFATPDEVRVGAVDPTSESAQELLYDIKERMRAEGGLYLISEASWQYVIYLYNTLPIVKPITKDITIKSEDIERVQANVNNFVSLQELLKQKSTTDLLTMILGAGLKLDASDVHIEAEDQQIIVRFRLDGILHDAATIKKDMYKQLISRIKLLASLKINITDRPQDGRFTIKFSEYDIDVRISTIPTVYGESIVMRLLRQTETSLTLDKLGIRGRTLELLKKEIRRPNGMIIATGPTGSGKTTTLYAILRILNKPGVKIITLEDPVEYRVVGLNQSQIDRSKDYTFAKGLRSMLRQDPDIVMVGEIRDLETADIAIQASLTGHLLLSTIHTNSAAGAVPRFLAIGVKPFLLMPSLNCIIGQRLVRLVCDKCRRKVALDQLEVSLKGRVEAILQKLPSQEKETLIGKSITFYEAVGCEACNNLGYRGRVNICELLIMTPKISEVITAGQVSEHEIQELARTEGMLTMVEDGMLKAMDGMTTLEEVFRVTE